jgi:formylglycine-generating enzyme required for sulfatase activity
MGSTAAQIQETYKTVRDDDKQLQACAKSESPRHQVILTQAFYMGVTEVTQRQYETITGKIPSYFAATGQNSKFAGKVADQDTGNFPVEGVTWNEAAEFCVKLSQKEDLKPFYSRNGETITLVDGTGYRLPREAEWESACRAGTTTRFWMGDTESELSRAAWFSKNSRERTHLAGETKANPLGLRDMHGNAWEWVEDWWDPKYYGQFPVKPAVNPRGPATAGSLRVYRGGGFNNPATRCRSSHRDAATPTYRGVIGFRVVLTTESLQRDREP